MTTLGGGIMKFTFSPPVNIASVQLLDIDKDETGGAVCTTRDSSGVVTTHGMSALGDNSFQELSIGDTDVVRLQVKFPSAHAGALLLFRVVPLA